MCTAIKYNDCFGRTLDYEKDFGEELVRLEKGCAFDFIHEGKVNSKYSIIGAAKIFEGVPLFFDGMNEAGLCAAALNFTGYAFYRGARCDGVNLASFELISYILSLCSSVEEVKYKLRGLNLTADSVSRALEATPLHWMVADKSESIVIEPLKAGVRIYENEIGVLTNAPDLDYHMTRLSDHMGLDAPSPENRLCNELSLTTYSRGLGAMGLPGDWSSSSRFVRAAFVKEKLDARDMSNAEAFFEIAKSVSVPRGCVISESGESVATLYTSCMDMTGGVYRYRKFGSETEKILEFH